MKNNISSWEKSVERQKTDKQIIYRKKGKVVDFTVGSTLHWFEIIINDWEKTIGFDDIPLEIDLTKVPVVVIGGGKWKHQNSRLEEFRKTAPDFKWVIFLLPYSWANWWSDGKLLIPDEKILWGKTISGEKIVIIEENERFLSNWEFVVDKVKKLGSRVIETLELIEKDPWSEVIAEILCKSYSNFDTPLYKEVQEVISELKILEQKRILNTWEDPRDIKWVVRWFIDSKLKQLNITKLTDISGDFHILPQEIDSELYEQRDVLGKIDIPWIGYKDLLSKRIDWHAVVELTLDDLKSIKNWPHKDIGIYIKEIYPYWDWDRLLRYWDLHEFLFESTLDDWERRKNILKYYQELSKKSQKDNEYPKEQELEDARFVDLPQNPEPFFWWRDFITNEEYICYPWVGKKKNWGTDKRVLKRFDSQEEANKIDKQSRKEANSYEVSRHIKKDLLSDMNMVLLSFDIPEEYVKKTYSSEEILDIIGLDKDKYVIDDKVSYWYTKPTSGYRDPDCWWEPGTDWSTTFLNEKNGKIYISKMWFEHLFEWFHVSEASCQISWLLSQLWLSEDKIQEIKNFFEQKEKQSSNDYERNVESIKQQIISSDEFSYLSISIQNKITDKYSNLYDIKDGLIKSRSDATNLMKKQNILVNRWWCVRTSWATKNQNYWVVMSNGDLRLPDVSSDGKVWSVVWPEELAISRSKSNTRANHNFIVDKLPIYWLTERQKETIFNLENKISERWESVRWISGNSSPDIEGWRRLWVQDILVEEIEENKFIEADSSIENDIEEREITIDDIQKLKNMRWSS